MLGKKNKEKKDRKRLKDTKFFDVLKTISGKIPEVFDVVAKVKQGDFRGAIEEAKDVVSKNRNKLESSEEFAAVAKLNEPNDELLKDLAQIDLEEFRLEVQDRTNARDLSKFRLKIGKAWIENTIALIVVGGSVAFFTMILVFTPKIDGEVQAMLVGKLAGIMEAALLMVIMFYFGASKMRN